MNFLPPLMAAVKRFSGNVLLSHTAARAVPSAQQSLTSVFGMGTGVTSALSSPESCYKYIKTLKMIVSARLWLSLTTD